MQHQQDGRPEVLGHGRSSMSFCIYISFFCVYANLLICGRPLLTFWRLLSLACKILKSGHVYPLSKSLSSRSFLSRLHEFGQTQQCKLLVTYVKGTVNKPKHLVFYLPWAASRPWQVKVIRLLRSSPTELESTPRSGWIVFPRRALVALGLCFRYKLRRHSIP